MFNNIGRSNQATVRPFIKRPSNAVPVPPSSLNDIFSSQYIQDNDDDDDDGDISASQLFRQSNFKVPTAPRGILKRRHQPVIEPIDEDNFFGSQSAFNDNDRYDDHKPTISEFFNDGNDDKFLDSQSSVQRQQLLPQVEDVIPSSQPSRRGQRFIPSFTSKQVRIADSTTSNQRSSNSIIRRDNHDKYGDESPATVADSPFTLAIPGYTTPGGTTHGSNNLRSVNEIPKQYRGVFPFPYFNIVQSKVLDDYLQDESRLSTVESVS